MTGSRMPSYYLMILGGSPHSHKFSQRLLQTLHLRHKPVLRFHHPMLLGIGTIYLAHLIHVESSKGYARGIIVAASSLIALWFLPGSFTNLFFSGPPLSFAGGIINELSTRQTRMPTIPATQVNTSSSTQHSLALQKDKIILLA